MTGAEAILNKTIEALIAEGVKFLLSEISEFVRKVLRHQSELQLPTSAMLSEKILLNGDMPYKLKKRVIEYKFNLKCIIVGIADLVEEKQYEDADRVIQNMNLLELEKLKVIQIVESQKRISLSFQTINIIIELFTKANDKIKEDIESSSNDFEENINFRLQNAVLVYELINFVTLFIEDFSLTGKNELKKIKDEVFTDIKNIESKIKNEVVGKYEAVSSETKKSASAEVKNYRVILRNMKNRWRAVDSKVKNLELQIEEYKTLLPDLKMFKSLAEIQIDVLQLVAIMNIVEQNINIVKKIKHLKRDLLVSFTAEDYYELIGRQPRL